MKIDVTCAMLCLGLASTAMAQSQSPSADYRWSVVYGNLISEPTATAAGVFTAIASSTGIGIAGATHARLRASMTLTGIAFFPGFPGPTPLPAIGGGTGYASGLFYTTFDLVASSPNANNGTFTRGWIRNGGLRPTSNTGILPPAAGSVNGIGAVQLAQQPGLAQPGNQSTSFADFWEIFWTTSDLTARTATFAQSVPGFASGPNEGPTQMILNVDPDPLNNFTPGFGMLATNYAPVSVVVVPAPGVAAVIGAAALVTARRRRQ